MKHKHHIIKCVNGKRIRTDETIDIDIKEHARRHKINYDKWGFREDYLAWKGLTGQWPKEKIIQEIYKINGKRKAHHMHTKQAIDKMRKTKLGSKLSKEHKEKIRLSRLGKKQTQHQKDTIRKLRQKDYVITYKNKTYEITNLLEFCRKKKLDQGIMTKVSQKKLQSKKGYSVAYK